MINPASDNVTQGEYCIELMLQSSCKSETLFGLKQLPFE